MLTDFEISLAQQRFDRVAVVWPGNQAYIGISIYMYIHNETIFLSVCPSSDPPGDPSISLPIWYVSIGPESSSAPRKEIPGAEEPALRGVLD